MSSKRRHSSRRSRILGCHVRGSRTIAGKRDLAIDISDRIGHYRNTIADSHRLHVGGQRAPVCGIGLESEGMTELAAPVTIETPDTVPVETPTIDEYFVGDRRQLSPWGSKYRSRPAAATASKNPANIARATVRAGHASRVRPPAWHNIAGC